LAERVHVIVPGPLDTPTGGFRYDRQMIRALGRARLLASAIELADVFPFPGPAALTPAVARIAALPRGAVLLVDGLALTALAAALAQRPDLRVVAIVHHLLGDECGLTEAARRDLLDRERTALGRTHGIVVTGAGTARRLISLGCNPDTIRLIPPGADAALRAPRPAARTTGSALRLLTVGSLIPRKGLDVLLRALAPLRAWPWQLTVVGAARDRAYALRLRAHARAFGLHGRILWLGAVSASRLEAQYAAADLFVLASRFEGYGMVLTEALGHGLPVIATAVGAAIEVVPRRAGRLVPPEDACALRSELRAAMHCPQVRFRLRKGAADAMRSVPPWGRAESAFVAAVVAMSAL
jgi:glycosyltransferase involved in cell wall biosynthesis